MHRSMRALAAACAVLLFSGCDEALMSAGPDAPGSATAGGAKELIKLSLRDQASYPDLVIGADGARHAIFLENDATGGLKRLFYRRSTDGGASWGEAELLSGRAETREVGYARLAVDGQGRVYAFWKALDRTGSDGPEGGVAQGTLRFRVLENGAWSDAVGIGREGRGFSWFPAVDPQGQLHVIWSEDVTDGRGIEQGNMAVAWVRRARVTGTELGAAEELVEAQPLMRGGEEYYYSHGGLSGRVDASGTVHWAAQRKDAETREWSLVYGRGSEVKALFPLSRYVGERYYGNPPQLLVDAAGQDHVLFLDQNASRQALLAVRPDGGEPVTVQAVTTSQGKIEGFQGLQGPGGRMGALLQMRHEGDTTTPLDLWVAEHRDGAWSATNVTRNAEQGSFVHREGPSSTSANVLTEYLPRHASGAWDAEGRLNLIFVSVERVTATTATRMPGDSSTSYGGGSMGSPAVVFTRL